MTDVQLVDVTLRDGNQSMWGATGVDTRMVRDMAPLLEQVGYRAVELTNSTQMAVAVRYQQEDPWERIRIARELMPTTPLGFLTTGKRFITFYRTPEALFELAFTLLVRAGVSRLWIVDPMHDMDSVKRMAKMAKRIGFSDVVAGICYTVSPVHTDEYFSAQAAKLTGSGDIDSVYLKDPGGLLVPERLRSLQPLLAKGLGDLAMDEIHTHCTTGLGPHNLLAAADLGMTTLHCALPPAADGGSHSNALQLVRNLKATGHKVEEDYEAMEKASVRLTRTAKRRRLKLGVPAQYDADYYRHTIPGGVQTTLARQLREMGQEHRYDEVIEESVQVREDLGWPIVMTPFAQYIVTQATLNVITGQRYSVLADEIVDLLRGDFGSLPGAVDQNLMDQAMATPRARATPAHEDEVSIEDLRQRFGKTLSEEELLLRAVMPQEQVDAMLVSQGSALRDARSLLKDFAANPGMRRISAHIGDASITAQRGSK